jgi:hypothetical protein
MASVDEVDASPAATAGASPVRLLLLALVVDLVVLAATGVLLMFRYRPHTWETGTTAMEIASRAHSIAAGGALLLLVALAVAIARAPRFGRLRGLVVGAGLAIAAAGVAIGTGARLAWQQLALYAVMTGQDIRGVVNLPDTVKFVLSGGQEMGLGEFRRRVVVHLLVLPVVFAIGLVILLRSRRPARPTLEDDACE